MATHRKTFSGPLGIYDSGIGGQIIARHIRQLLPDISIISYADRGSFPLGNKSKSDIKKTVRRALDMLYKKGCPLVLLACNTASVTSVRYLQQDWIPKKHPGKNILGVSIPLLELMNKTYGNLKSKRGLILSTPTTHQTEFYQTALREYGFTNIESVDLPNLATIIEKKDRKLVKKEVSRIAKKLGPKAKLISYLILACTHYPNAIDEIRSFFSPGISIIDPTQSIAQKLKNYLERHPEYRIERDIKRYEIIEV